MCADTASPSQTDYRDTVFLPETDFPMRAGLPQREPDWLARWARIGVYDRLREKAALANGTRQPFTLHDGPPYANGHLHIGHALNKILKDMVVRGALMEGRRVRFVPGWDTHGLPVEIEVEKQLGFNNKQQIEEYGIDKFNEVVRKCFTRQSNRDAFDP